ncbi:hypothetical protein M3A49_18435 [Paraburkholderia sp. CNPSo 3076]|uniref:hypothetical protein n=1 Tax=Paraburkholderia sp. CNPSo 3076 TaxID=2940936 RepID=UPI00225309AB|nr:hypothetical protein [Paraburkholderia sp. CNPSo 3076]MCX5541452.1 hypothetical protein [Paraburkholderia sp. CNPSo 3076]
MSTSASQHALQHPYYIHAPGYRETSSGIVVLHTLCHELNIRGHEAYIVGTPVVNPAFQTPVLTAEILNSHRQRGLVPVVVYPEIVSGNPLGAQVCVRYILNNIGRLTGKQLNEGKDDLIFYYSENFIGDKGKDEIDYLFLPVVDPNLFKPDPAKVRDKTFVFQYRYPLEKIDFSRFPAGTELLSMSTPVSLAELAAKLQTGKALYTYEPSAVCTEAMMCGCPVIYMSEGGLPETPDRFLFGTNGSAMASERNGLLRAEATVSLIHPIVAAQMEVFAAQLPYFVESTQAASRKVQASNQAADVAQANSQQAAPLPEKAPLTPGVLILDPAGDEQKIQQSLQSLDVACAKEHLVVVVTTLDAEVPQWTPRLRYLKATAREYAAVVKAVSAHAEINWLTTVEAGTSLAEFSASQEAAQT